MDRERLGKSMLLLAEAFGEQLSDAKIEAYALALDEESIDALEAAVVPLLRTVQRFPPPVLWLEAAREWRRQSARAALLARQLSERTTTAAVDSPVDLAEVQRLLEQLNTIFQWRDPEPVSAAEHEARKATALAQLKTMAARPTDPPTHEGSA